MKRKSNAAMWVGSLAIGAAAYWYAYEGFGSFVETDPLMQPVWVLLVTIPAVLWPVVQHLAEAAHGARKRNANARRQAATAKK